MVGLILVLLLCTILAGGVIGYVAWQARLDGRQVLTETGEEALSGLRRRASTATERRRRPRVEPRAQEPAVTAARTPEATTGHGTAADPSDAGEVEETGRRHERVDSSAA